MEKQWPGQERLVVADHSCALFTISEPLVGPDAFPVSQLIEHSGYAEVLLWAFEQAWASAAPYPGTVRDVSPKHSRRSKS